MLIAGCSSSSARHGPAHSAQSSAPSSVPLVTDYGQDAALLATHIPHCASPQAEDVGGGGSTGMVGKATCTLLGHPVVIYTWKDEASETSATSMIADSVQSYSTGIGWTETLGDDGAADAQHAVAAAVAAALNGEVKGS